MIQRKASKITDSFVNSAHEEHFNVTKAIRDDAPVVAMDSVVKSVNFEADGDGSYILRKPLVKKASLNAANQVLLYDKANILSIEDGRLSITDADKIVLRFYDNRLALHEYEYKGYLYAPWLTVKASYGTPDHTLLNCEIDHGVFLRNVDFGNNAKGYMEDTDTVDSWKWMLVNDTWDVQDGFDFPGSIGNVLKRFVKIYKHASQKNAYVVDIVQPELNSISSGLDTGNAQTLDVNLLLENPYAIRDLYGYGYVSCTKILPYVYNGDDGKMTAQSFGSIPIWQLTEKNHLNIVGGSIYDSFRILVSSSPKSFGKRFLFLKAFLTTAITSARFYCCWERSEDNGITWKECPEFITKNAGKLSTVLVSDLSSADFDKTVYKDSLEKAAGYLVSKKVARLDISAKDLSFDDPISDRPDVLILDNPDLSHKYRFMIYLETDMATPTPESKTFTHIATNFTDPTEGYIDNNAKIRYKTSANGSSVPPELSGGKLILHEASGDNLGVGSFGNPSRYGVGNSISISSVDDMYRLKSVTITLAPRSLVSGTSDYERLGSAIGAIAGDGAMPYYGEDANAVANPYGMSNVRLEEFRDDDFGAIRCDATNLWVSESSSKTFVASSYGDGESLTFVNLTRCLMGFESDAYPQEDLVYVSGDPDITHSRLAISSIAVTYVVKSDVQCTSVYLASATGTFSLPYSETAELAEDLSSERERLFNGRMFYNDQQAQLLAFSGDYVYSSDMDSAIVRILNGMRFPDAVTKIIPWRSYLIVFTEKASYLAKYDASGNAYSIKTLSNSIGVSKKDADTVVTILNSVYFKSGTKIYRLVPNLYAASDDVLNVHQISLGVNNILEGIANEYEESHNFAYSDADAYMVFIPIRPIDRTLCIAYDFNRKLWAYLEYPAYLSDLERLSNSEVYLATDSGLYYFRERLSKLLSLGLGEFCEENGEDAKSYDMRAIANAVPYADYLNSVPKDLVSAVIGNAATSHSYERSFEKIATPIRFEIDFGQKSSNYTLDKQFLETKLTLATLSSKDSFPLSLDIRTDGVSRELHWDANTDGAIWKSSLDDIGILNTGFGADGQDYDGILRQLIVKYSGKGKTIRHIISGKSKSLFKFYSMDVRGRILPKKH